MEILGTNFNLAKVLVVGDIMLDRYWYGDACRISPEAPVPVVKINEQEQRIGGAGNVALNIAALGGEVTIFSLVGDDTAADDLQQILTNNKVNSSLTRIKTLNTIIKLRILSHHQQLIRTDFEQDFTQIDKTELLTNFNKQLTQASTVVLSDYGKGVLSNPQDFITTCNKFNKPILIDPKGNNFSRYQGATLITPNRAEFELVVGVCHSLTDIVAKAKPLLEQYNIGALLITLSEDGMILIEKNGNHEHLPTQASEIFDVTGAGDTVIATFATGIATGLNFSQAMESANLAAGIVVAKLGTSTVSQIELQLVQQSTHPSDNLKIYQLPQLKSLTKNLDQVVMTNGCFDILHAGHVSYLQAAKNLGKVLIVAVNSDESVVRLKGNSRPIQPLAQRMQMLAGLTSVDFVVSFAQDTPEHLYCELLPNILVKGGDYQANDIDKIAGASCVQQAGGKVEILHFVEGQSSSSIINKIKDGK